MVGDIAWCVMAKKILLISPQLRIRKTPKSEMSKNTHRRAQPLLSIGSIATVLHEHGYEVEYLDSVIEDIENSFSFDEATDCYGLSNDEIIRRVVKFNPDLVGITCLSTSQFSQTVAVAKAIKLYRDIPIIVGGNHPSLNYNDAIRHGCFDCIVRGEGEERILEVLEGYYKTGCLPQITPMSRVAVLDDLPYYNWDLVPLEKYWRDALPQNPYAKSRKAILYETSRGCPERCTFCSTRRFFGQKFRTKSSARVVEELTTAVQRYGIKELQFSDDSMAVKINRFLEICEGLKPLKVHLCNPSGIRLYEKNEAKLKDIFQKMQDAGFYQMTFAVESGDVYILNSVIKKRLDLEWVKKTIKIAKDYFKIHAFFMIGLPYETKKQIDATISFAEELKADSYSLSLAQPFPATELWEWCERDGLIKDGIKESDMLLGKQVIKRTDGLNLEKLAEEVIERLNCKSRSST